MERNIALTVAAFSLAAVGIAIMLPGRPVDPDPKVPWRIEVNADGSSSVLGVTLGHTTLGEVETLFDEGSELTLFVAKDDSISVEAFFEKIFLSGLRADMVMALDIPEAQKQAMFDRGARMSKLGSGEKKVTLSNEDEQAARQFPIRHITYLPMADLEPQLLESRFGTPARRVPADRGIEHWLYPEQGLDIAVDPERKEVFQYVAPKDFQQLVTEPLSQATQTGDASN
jgi:hypothetical protein